MIDVNPKERRSTLRPLYEGRLGSDSGGKGGLCGQGERKGFDWLKVMFKTWTHRTGELEGELAVFVLL